MEKTSSPSNTTPPQPNKLEITVLSLQIESVQGNVEQTFVQKVHPLIMEKVGKPVDVVVLPECALTGYDFPDKSQVLTLAEVSGKGPQYEYAKQIAVTLGAYVAMGYIEKHADKEGSLKCLSCQTWCTTVVTCWTDKGTSCTTTGRS